MANGNSGGPWRSSGQGPWGQDPRNIGPGDLDEVARRLRERLGRLLPGGGGRGGAGGPNMLGLSLIVVGALLIWLLFGSFYSVQPNEVGLNLVFGAYTGKTGPGLNINWPWPVGSVIRLPVADQQIIEIGYRDSDPHNEILAEAQMLTGDQNLVDVEFRVIWQIDPAHPEYYAFNVLNPADTVKAVAESTMREVVGLKSIDGILTSERKSIEPDVQKRMQAVLEEYKVGVLILQVQLQGVDAPRDVIPSYRDVTAAQQDEQRLVNDAETYANRVVPEAEGQASKINADAQAYREQTILDAKGQTQRYSLIQQQYAKAPEVTRERMYLETLEHVLGPAPKTLLDANSGAAAPVPYIAIEPNASKSSGAGK